MNEERSVLDYLIALAYAEIDAAIRDAIADDEPSDSDIVAAIAARELDDADREQAISVLRWAVDDYDFAVGQAGDLGGTELT